VKSKRAFQNGLANLLAHNADENLFMRSILVGSSLPEALKDLLLRPQSGDFNVILTRPYFRAYFEASELLYEAY
jgi:hypothetical protein